MCIKEQIISPKPKKLEAVVQMEDGLYYYYSQLQKTHDLKSPKDDPKDKPIPIVNKEKYLQVRLDSIYPVSYLR